MVVGLVVMWLLLDWLLLLYKLTARYFSLLFPKGDWVAGWVFLLFLIIGSGFVFMRGIFFFKSDHAIY